MKKLILILLLLLPLTTQAVWWNPATWFDKPAQEIQAGDSTINKIEQWMSTTSPFEAISPRIHAKNIYAPFSNATTSTFGASLICIGSDCRSSWPVAGVGGGSGNVATSTTETAGYLSYWTSNGDTPALLGQVATGTITIDGTPQAGSYVVGNNISFNTSGSSFAYPFTIETNFDTTNSATSTPLWLQGGLNASSTARFSGNMELWDGAEITINAEQGGTISFDATDMQTVWTTLGSPSSGVLDVYTSGTNSTASLNFASLSTDRTFTFPDITGTLCISGGNCIEVGTTSVNSITTLSNLSITKSQVSDFGTYQEPLVSGTNIKTINGNSLLGSGDLTISGSGSGLASSTPWTFGSLVIAKDNGSVTTISTSTIKTSELTNDANFITSSYKGFIETGTTSVNSITTLSNLSITESQISDLGPYENPLTFNWPLIRNTNTISWGGLSTSSAATIGNIPYFSGVNTFANVATSSKTCTAPLSCTAFDVVGSGSGAITISTAGDWTGTLDGFDGSTLFTGKVSTSSTPTIGNLAYWTGNGTPSTLGTVATSSVTCSGGTTCSNLIALGSSPSISSPAWPFTVNTGYNSTTTVIGFLTGGVFSNASSTFSGDFRLPALSPAQGFLYVGSTGKVNSIASSSINLSSLNNDAGFTTYAYPFPSGATSTPISFTYASSTYHSFGTASSTQWEGGGLISCNADNQTLGYNATTKQFTCGDDDSAAGSGGGTVGTSTIPTIGQVPFWTTSGQNIELLGSVATSSVTINAPLTSAGTAGYVIGGSGWTIDIDDIKAADLDLTDITLADFTNDAGFTTFAYPFPAGATTTIVDFTNSLTVSGGSQGFAYLGSGNKLLTISSSTIKTSWLTNDSGFTSYAWPFTPTGTYVSTSTTLGLLNGFFSTASSTISNNFYLPALSQGFAYIGSAGKVNTIASSSINLSWLNNDSGFITGLDWNGIGGDQSNISLSGFTDDLSYENPLTFNFPLIRSTDTISFGGFSTTTNTGLNQGIGYVGSGGIFTTVSTSSPLNTSITGNSGTATALADNGSNCSAGYAPLGVNASGASESCFDVWTEAENTSAGYISDGNTNWDNSYGFITGLGFGNLYGVATSSDDTGDIYYRNSSGQIVNLGAGSDGDVLKLSSGIPSWGTDLTGSGGAGLSTSTAIVDTYMIYGTSASTVGAEAAFTYDDATNLLTVGNITSLGTFTTGLSDGFAYIGSGNLKSVASSSINLSEFNNDAGFLTSALTSYDAWTHSASGKSATTSSVGIGTSSPYAELAVAGGDNNIPLFAADTSSGFTGNLMELRRASTSQFSVGYNGDISLNGGNIKGALEIQDSEGDIVMGVTDYALYDEDGNQSVTFGIDRGLYDDDGFEKLSWTNSSLFFAGSHATAYDWEWGEMYDKSEVASVNFLDRVLLDSGGDAILNWYDTGVGIGTSTPNFGLVSFSATAPQLSLSAGAGKNQWVFRNEGGQLAIATSTYTATSSVSALRINTNGQLQIPNLVSCNTIDTDANGVLSCGTDEGGVGGTGNPDFTYATDIGYGVTGSATTTKTQFTLGVHASSTSHFSNATSTLLTAVTGWFTNLFIGAVDIAEYIADTAGSMFTGNTETGVTVTYQDADNTIDVVCNTADTNTFGCLTDTDWDTFNGKQSALTFSAPLLNTGGTVSLATTTGSFSIASSTFGLYGKSFNSATTTIDIGGLAYGINNIGFNCKTDSGTVGVVIGNGTASTTYMGCTSTAAQTYSTADIAQWGSIYLELHTKSGTPNRVTISPFGTPN